MNIRILTTGYYNGTDKKVVLLKEDQVVHYTGETVEDRTGPYYVCYTIAKKPWEHPRRVMVEVENGRIIES